MKYLLVLATIFLYASCNLAENDFRGNRAGDINIYIIKEGQLQISDNEFDLDKLKLEEVP